MTLSKEFEYAIMLKMDLMLSLLFTKHDLIPDIDAGDVVSEAYVLGFSSEPSKAVSILFDGSPLLASYEAGLISAQSMKNLKNSIGTKEEWDALSDETKVDELDRFQALCITGGADEMYFYDVIMTEFLKSYAGH